MQKQNSFSFILAIVCICIVGAGCMNGKKLWRSYERKPFDAQSWQSADTIERGTMSHDLIGIRTIWDEVGTNKAEIIQTLGTPDKIRKDKIGQEEATVLMYEIDLGEPEFFYALQIYLQDEKPVFANKGALSEKETLLDRLKKSLNIQSLYPNTLSDLLNRECSADNKRKFDEIVVNKNTFRYTFCWSGATDPRLINAVKRKTTSLKKDADRLINGLRFNKSKSYEDGTGAMYDLRFTYPTIVSYGSNYIETSFRFSYGIVVTKAGTSFSAGGQGSAGLSRLRDCTNKNATATLKTIYGVKTDGRMTSKTRLRIKFPVTYYAEGVDGNQLFENELNKMLKRLESSIDSKIGEIKLPDIDGIY